MFQKPIMHRREKDISPQQLRDFLAIDRTNLGNMRTLFATIRTSIALLGLGASFLKFLNHGFFHTIAYISIFAAVFILFFGLIRYLTYSRYLHRISHHHEHLSKITDASHMSE